MNAAHLLTCPAMEASNDIVDKYKDACIQENDLIVTFSITYICKKMITYTVTIQCIC